MTTQIMNDYEKQASDALLECNTTIHIKLANNKQPEWRDKNSSNYHDHYIITMKNSNGRYSFDFFQSVAATQKGEAPNEYDVIACLEWFTPESFEDFCSEFGYDTDSRQAEKTWKACLVMTRNLHKLFTADQIELLSQIR